MLRSTLSAFAVAALLLGGCNRDKATEAGTQGMNAAADDAAADAKANPTALLRSALMMLEHLGEKQYAERIENALNETLLQKEQCTGDLGGKASTTEFTQHIIDKLK